MMNWGASGDKKIKPSSNDTLSRPATDCLNYRCYNATEAGESPVNQAFAYNDLPGSSDIAFRASCFPVVAADIYLLVSPCSTFPAPFVRHPDSML